MAKIYEEIRNGIAMSNNETYIFLEKKKLCGIVEKKLKKRLNCKKIYLSLHRKTILV